VRDSFPSALKVRGVDMASRTTRNCVPDGVIQKHVRQSAAMGHPTLMAVPAHDRTMIIAGSGPSLPEIDPSQGDIFALGGAHDWLISNGTVPYAFINADPLPLIAQYLNTPHRDVIYYIASHSHKYVFNRLFMQNVVIWHDEVDAGTQETVIDEDHARGLSREHIAVTGGSTGATRAPFLGHELGYRKFRYVGVDGSGGRTGAALREKPPIDVEVGGREFQAPINFIHQAAELEAIMAGFPEWEITVAGDGLMAAVAESARG
jgi:hypothetical protein